MRSGDFVPALSRPISPAERKQLAAEADRSILAELQKAKSMQQVDILCVHAEEAGNLLAIRRAFDGNPRVDSPAVAKLGAQVEALLHRIIDTRVSNLTALAAAPGGPDAIRQGESEALSLKTDLHRLIRFGFSPRSVDIDALDMAIKRAVVDTVTGRRGWTPP